MHLTENLCPSIRGFREWVFVLFVVFSVTPARASITRQRTLGEANFILRDHANIWYFPSTLYNYPNYVQYDLGGAQELIYNFPNLYGFNRGAGISWGVGKRHVVGAYVIDARLALPTTSVQADYKFDAFWNYQLGNSVIGARFGRASGKTESANTSGGTTSSTSSAASITFLAGGISYPRFAGLDATLDVGVTFERHNFESKVPGAPNQTIDDRKPTDGTFLQLSGRVFWSMSKTADLVPFVNIFSGKEGIENDPNIDNTIDNTQSFAQSEVLIGIGSNIRPSAEAEVVFGVAYLRRRSTTEFEVPNATTSTSENKVDNLPFLFGGFEARLLKWLYLRVGFQQRVYKTTTENRITVGGNVSESVNKLSASQFQHTFGIGFEHRNVTIDFSLDPNYFKRGPYTASGSGADMFNLVTVGYRFK